MLPPTLPNTAAMIQSGFTEGRKTPICICVVLPLFWINSGGGDGIRRFLVKKTNSNVPNSRPLGQNSNSSIHFWRDGNISPRGWFKILTISLDLARKNHSSEFFFSASPLGSTILTWSFTFLIKPLVFLMLRFEIHVSFVFKVFIITGSLPPARQSFDPPTRRLIKINGVKKFTAKYKFTYTKEKVTVKFPI